VLRSGPRLILVGGTPASGKTTLARRIARTFRLPLLSRDEIKEALYDTLGAPDPVASRALGPASFAVLYAVLTRLLDAGVGAVVESNLYRGRSEAELRELAGRARTVLVHCETTASEIRRRYLERAGSDVRHPGHHDAALLAQTLDEVAAGVFDPLQLGVPAVRVTTTSGYDPDYRSIVAAIRTRTRPASCGESPAGTRSPAPL
jgi:predicted kinase